MTNNSVSLQSQDEIISEIKLSSSLNQLIGAKIYDRWKETVKKKTIYYAAVVMGREETARIYTQLIDDNRVLIEKLIAMSATEKTTITAVARYYCAADIADANDVFINILLVLGVSPKNTGNNTGLEYRLSAKDSAAQIPIAITVKGDMDDRIKTAFATVFSEYGFISGEQDARYILDAELKIVPEQSLSSFVFSRYTLNATLIDASNKATLLPFSVNDHEGHTTQSGADSHALMAAVNKVKKKYAAAFGMYLTNTMN